MAGYGQPPPWQPGGSQGEDVTGGSLMHGLRQSDDAIDPHDPEFAPLGSNVVLPPYLAGDPAYDPAAPQYDAAGGYGDDHSSPAYDRYHEAQPSGRSGAADGTTSPGADGSGGAAQQRTPASGGGGGGSISAFSIEAATPPSQLGPDGRPRNSMRRNSIEVV